MTKSICKYIDRFIINKKNNIKHSACLAKFAREIEIYIQKIINNFLENKYNIQFK